MKYEIIKGSEKYFEGVPANVLTLYRFAGHIDLHGSLLPSIYTHISGKTETIAERRPITEPVWDGSGVPCVGQKVMTKSGEGIIDYVGSGVIVYSNNDGQWSVRCDSLDYSLSAIRSPEDVARDEVIANICFEIGVRPNNIVVQQTYDAIAAGKITGITKTPTVSELMRVTENATREDCEAIVKMLSGK